ncbi:hypothetical protein [Rhodoplanes sp. Z2-YC6860]|uniref:hypothetical protein n=1 Tax=Rhodoplanes sp. Z2-YC6860 TaxID=674703 RepID=UPI000831B993|nr:hypothetical protein [Rhodoplanes sp. Z2-YC6860]
MRGLIVLTALAGVALASPAFAEDVYIGGRAGGVGVGVDVGPGYHRGYRERDVYTSGYDRGYDRGYERCRTTVIRRDDGSVKKIRRCRD